MTEALCDAGAAPAHSGDRGAARCGTARPGGRGGTAGGGGRAAPLRSGLRFSAGPAACGANLGRRGRGQVPRAGSSPPRYGERDAVSHAAGADPGELAAGERQPGAERRRPLLQVSWGSGSSVAPRPGCSTGGADPRGGGRCGAAPRGAPRCGRAGARGAEPNSAVRISASSLRAATPLPAGERDSEWSQQREKMGPLSRRCRLFDLDPDLLPLFQYNCKQFASPQECLAAPEFLDHIRKVRGVGAIRGWVRDRRESMGARGRTAVSPRRGGSGAEAASRELAYKKNWA